MLWEGKPLRDVCEADIRNLLESGLAEHLQLEYKSALYEDNERGRRELLLDVCMFANTSGGILLIGIPERRDEQGQPTGVPDLNNGTLGLELPNPEAALAAYDARVMEAIEERLPLESAAIEVGNRRVLALRVPNSASKPHSVRHQGHIYFPSRRDRQRFNMTVREIKELVMRTTSHLQQAEETLANSFLEVQRTGETPYQIIGMMPVFFENFMVDVRPQAVHRSITSFTRVEQQNYYVNPGYTFDGLERHERQFEYTVRFRRNGLLNSSQQLPVFLQQDAEQFHITAIDQLLRQFVLKASAVYEAASTGAPYVLGMMLRIQRPLTGVHAVGVWIEDQTTVPAGDYRFPFMQIDDLSSTDRIIRPFCDQAHQMFGREASPNFNAEGRWAAR